MKRMSSNENESDDDFGDTDECVIMSKDVR